MAISNPQVNIQIIPAYQVPQNEEQKILFVGQKTSAGSAPAGSLVESIGNTREEDDLFGDHSLLAAMVRAAKKYNKITRMDALVLDDSGSGVAATRVVGFTGTASAAGSYTVYNASRKNHAYTLNVANGATATVIGDALETLINNDNYSPISANNVSGSVTLTALNDGLTGNDIGFQIIGSIPGVTVSITDMSGGLNDPNLSTIFSLVDNIRYQTVVMPVSYLAQSYPIDFLNNRWNPSGDKILDGIGVVGKTGVYAGLIADITTAENSQNFTIIPNRAVNISSPYKYEGSALFELDYVIAAQFAAVRALRLTPGASLADFVVASEDAKDYFGGIHIATLPYHNTPFRDLPIIDNDQMWSDSERDQLKSIGYTILGNNVANTEIIADSAITRYRKDGAGNDDLSFKYINYVDQSSNVREYFHNNLKADFAQSRLTLGDLIPGYNMANKGIIKGAIMRIYGELANFALVPAGEDARKAFLRKLEININEIAGEVTITMLDPVITQLRKIAATMQLTFSLA